MELKPELVPPLLPAIPVEDLPVADRENGLAFFRNLVMLHYWSFDFSAAVALFELAQSSRSASRFNPADRWPFLAARGGALALRNHMEMFAAGRALIGKISGWRDRINGKELRAIDRCLAERFPKIDKLRHAVAHPEFYADPTIDMTGPAVAEDGIYIAGGGSMQDFLHDRKYRCTINGMHVSYELTCANAAFLAHATSAIYETVSAPFGLAPLRR